MTRIFVKGVELKIGDGVDLNITSDGVEVFNRPDIHQRALDRAAHKERTEQKIALAHQTPLAIEGPKKRGKQSTIPETEAVALYRQYDGLGLTGARGPATDPWTFRHLQGRIADNGMGTFSIMGGKVMEYMRDKDEPIALRLLGVSLLTRKMREYSHAKNVLSSIVATLAHMGLLEEVSRAAGGRNSAYIITPNGRQTTGRISFSG